MSTSKTVQATLVDKKTLKGILPETSASSVFFEDGESLQQKFNNDDLIKEGVLGLLNSIQCVSPTITVDEKEDQVRLVITNVNGTTFTPNLKGSDGKSVYDIAVETGFQGTKKEWIESIRNSSAYDLAVQHGYEGTEKEWLESLVGEKGEDGVNGQNAYELAVSKGFIGTEEEWLMALRGAEGPSAYDIAVEYGFKGSPEQWLKFLKGRDGASAYDVAVEYGYVGSHEQWLRSLRGKDGVDGENGLSAYEIAVKYGFEGTEEEWVESLGGSKDPCLIFGVKGSAETEYRTGLIEIAKEHIAGLDKVENTLDEDKHVAHAISSDTANSLSTARQIIIAGALETSASFDGSSDVTLTIPSIKADKLEGIVPIENLPIGGVLATLEETLAKKVEITNVPLAGALTVAVADGNIESSGVKLNELLNSFTGETALIPVNTTIVAKNYGETTVKIPEALIGGLTFNVYHNGSLLVEDLHYTVDNDNGVIHLLGFTTYEGDLFSYVAFAGGNGKQEILPGMLPIATDESVGAVKSTKDIANYVSVDEEGRMYIEKINFNSVVMDETSEEEIIFVSGNAH